MKVLGPALNLGAKPIIPVPAGGAQGQVLAKNSATDYDLAWANPSTDGGGAANTLNFRGAFSTSGTYAVDDLVSYNGAFYICKNAVAASGSAPTDATGSLTYTTQPGNWPVNDGDYSTMAFDCGSQASCTVTSATPVVFNSFRVYDCPAYPAYTLALAGVTSLVLKVDGVVVNTITTCPAKVSDAHGGYYELDFGSVTGLSASVTFHFTASDFVGSEIRTFTGGVVPLTAPDTDPTDWLLLIPAPTAAYTPPTGLMTYQGAFSSAANYAVDSVVSYNGAYYLAKKAVTAFVSAPTDISAAVTYAGSGFGAFTGDACKNGNLTDYAYDTGGFTNSTFTFTAVPGTVFNCVRFYDTPQYPTWGMAAALISSIVLKVDGVTVNTLGAAPALTNGYFEVDFGNVSGTVATVTFYEGRTFMGAEARVFSGPTPAPNPTTDTTDWLLLIPAAGAAAPGTMVDTGAYSGAATYALGNVVSYGGKYYVAKCAVSPPPAGVTWDAVNSSATLSNGNLTALCSSSQAFSNTFKTAGKWYAEYVVVSGTEATFAVSSASGTEVGWASAKAFQNLTGLSAGNVIGVLVDIDGLIMYFYLNNVLQATKPITAAATYCLEVGIGADTVSLTARFAAAGMSYPSQGLFLPWDSAVTVTPDVATTSWDALTGAAGVSAKAAQFLVDFGAEEAEETTTTVAFPSVLIGSIINCSVFAGATADHDPEDAVIEGVKAYAANIVPGVGFDLFLSANDTTWGKYLVNVQVV